MVMEHKLTRLRSQVRFTPEQGSGIGAAPGIGPEAAPRSVALGTRRIHSAEVPYTLNNNNDASTFSAIDRNK